MIVISLEMSDEPNFFVRVFCSTPKIQREFARGLSFRRKFSKYEKFT